jgi:ubiquinone/menaquinone biosynthesis C-methylase UbiE
LNCYDEIMPTNPTVETYDKYAQIYDEEVVEFWANFPQSFINKFVSSLPGKRVLNLGSGSGRDAVLLREHGLEVVCLDASKAMVEITNRLGFESHHATFAELNFPEASFDGVWAYTSLIHIPKDDAQKAIIQVHSMLKLDGAFVMGAIEGDTAGMVERKTMPGAIRYFKNYSKDELRQLIEPVGFIFVYEEDYKPHNNVYLNQLYLRA